MSTNHTTNYDLCQWEATDQVLRTDFNQDNAKIDAALAANAGIMKGMICAWSGAEDAIPTGWALCDGTRGTPDLRGKFLLGGGGSYVPGSTGGEERHTLTVDEMPSHTHNVDVPRRCSVDELGDAIGQGRPSTYQAAPRTSTNTGGGQSHNNMPPYYALCFVMYLGADGE